VLVVFAQLQKLTLKVFGGDATDYFGVGMVRPPLNVHSRLIRDSFRAGCSTELIAAVSKAMIRNVVSRNGLPSPRLAIRQPAGKGSFDR
jgi:hypothetical protein